MSCLRRKQQKQQLCTTHSRAQRAASFSASLPTIRCRETQGTQRGCHHAEPQKRRCGDGSTGTASLRTARPTVLPNALQPSPRGVPTGRARCCTRKAQLRPSTRSARPQHRAPPGRHLPVHAALQVGHGALPARAALEAAVAEALHEALLEGAALPCNTQRGPRCCRARAGARAALRGSGARRQVALPHRSDPAGRRPCPAAAA